MIEYSLFLVQRTDDDVSIHDGVLWSMNTSGLDKLILYIASSEGEQHWCIHAAEIISRMLREQVGHRFSFKFIELMYFFLRFKLLPC